MTTEAELKPKRSDAAALGIAVVLGIAAIGITLWQLVARLIEIVPNRDVPVTAWFADTAATLPIGPGGQEVEVVAQEVVLRVSDLPGVTLFSLVAAEVTYAAAVITTITLVCLIIRNLMRGRAFTRQTVGFVGGATVAVAAGWLLTLLFRTMGANGAAAALAQEYPANTATPVTLVTAFAVASLGALTVAFQAGSKLRRDTEGLV